MASADSRVAELVRIAEERYEAHVDSVNRSADRMFAWLLGAEWAFAILLAIVFSPYGWEGKTHTIHAHVPIAIVLGGLIVSAPIALALRSPGAVLTRHVVAVGQILISALLIHLSGGRIETHFHVFGSLAFLAFYRDWKVLITGTLAVVADHLVRGIAFPESVYGIANPEWWRFLEHAFWVIFIDIVLVIECLRAAREMRMLSEQGAQLEAMAMSPAPAEVP